MKGVIPGVNVKGKIPIRCTTVLYNAVLNNDLGDNTGISVACHTVSSSISFFFFFPIL